jgi:Bacteriophage minor capsid protein
MVEEVKSYILASSLGGNPWIDPANGANVAGNIFLYFMPSDGPDQVCVLYQDPGKQPQLALGGTVAWYNPRLRIVNRAAIGNFSQAQLDAEHIRDLLLAVANQSLSTTRYLKIMPAGEPRAESLDPSNRPLFVTEYEVMKYFSE